MPVFKQRPYESKNRLLCTQLKQVTTKRPKKIEVIFTPGTPGVIFLQILFTNHVHY